MGRRDPRVDAYIAKAAPFAQPILLHLRELIHETCPDVEETIKWSMPSYVHAGGILCGMAAFKQHVSFGFWKHALVIGEGTPRDGMGSFGRMSEIKQLPPKTQLRAWLRKAMALNEQGVKSPSARKSGTSRPMPAMPPELADALAQRKHAKARRVFEAFAPSHRREYMEWIGEAKREETRAKRLAQALEWLAVGKSRNWKYADC